jgi:putative hydrolase of the HAD superfamily
MQGDVVIRTLLFDMGNVLVFFSHELMCVQMGSLCGKSGAEIREILFNTGMQAAYERGHLSPAAFFEQFKNSVGHNHLDAATLLHAASDIFELNAELVPILDALKSHGYRLVLLSNTSTSHFEFVRRRFNVLERFDEFVVSFEAGAIKPEPAIFASALKKIGCAPEEAFFTDDVPENVATAREFGLQAELYTTIDALRQQLWQRGVRLDPVV